LYNLFQKLLAEFFGAAAVIFITAGAICADESLHLQAQHGLGTLGIAIATGLSYAVMITAIAHISGGHLNPAVTIGYWVTKRISTLDAITYWIAQLLGATAAAWALSAIVSETVWRPVGLGAPDLATDFTRLHGIFLEAAVTFLLVFVIFATAVDPRSPAKPLSGLAAGLTMTMCTLVAAPFTGAAMNPARAFATALIAHHWTNHGVFWVGPLVGGVIAGWLYNSFLLKEA
jgi:MIP family channel proteins